MKTQQVTVGAFILDRKGKFLIVRRAPSENYLPGLWELPGGGSKYGETPQAALKREIREECGLDIDVRQPLTTANYFIKDTQRIEIIFLCTLTGTRHAPVLSAEHDAFVWVAQKETRSYSIDKFMTEILDACCADLDYLREKYLQ